MGFGLLRDVRTVEVVGDCKDGLGWGVYMKTERGRGRKVNHKHTDHGPRYPSFRSQESLSFIFQERYSAEEATRVYYYSGCHKDSQPFVLKNLFPTLFELFYCQDVQKSNPQNLRFPVNRL